jgi:Tol biopolymer transport system component
MLGAGGMGEVYRARDARLNRDVAVKVLPSEVSSDPSRLRRFEQEARAAGALNHPNVLAVYDIGSHEGVPYVVSELLEGETLRDRLQAGDFPLRKAVDFAVQIVHGLAAAHEKGIVHRDLKPENLFVTKDGRVKILDFGLAKLLEPESVGSQAGTGTAKNEILGTVGYMSPEQVKGQGVDQRADIFAFGAVFYEMLSKRKAFRKDTGAETLAAILTEDPPDLAAGDPGIPTSLSRIVRRCLEKRPEERFQSARDLGFALEALSGSSETAPGLKAISLEKAPSGSRRRNAMLVGAVAILAVLGWIALRSRRADTPWENPLAGARFTRLTDWDGSEVDAAISADGKFVAFLADREGGVFDAWVGQVGGTGFVNLTHGRFPGLFSATVRNIGFTPDGAHVWVHVTAKDLADHRIWLIPTLGGEPRPFLSNAVSAAWSPDGKRLVYHEPRDGDAIFIAEASGAGLVKRFQDRPGFHWHDPAWGSDGRSLFFTQGLPPEEMDLWRLPVASGPAERMTKLNARVRYPTPLDARTVVYCANGEEGPGSALYALDVDSRISKRISSGLEEFLSIAATADGMRLVAALANPDRNLWTVPVTEGVADEARATRLSLATVRAIRPRWDHDSLLFLSSREGSDRLFRSRGRELSELWNPVGGSISGAPAVSPDGANICFPVRRDGRTQLQVIAADGTNPRSLGTSLDLHDSAAWSADSKWIAVSATDEKGFGLFKVPVDGGAVQPLVAGFVWNPVWSPDGRFIVYSESIPGPRRRLRAVNADGTSHPVPELIVVWTGDRYRFLNDSRRLIALKGPFRNQDFWLVDLETGKERQLTNLKPGYEPKSFDVSPDGRQIVFDRVWENSDIVLIDRVRR